MIMAGRPTKEFDMKQFADLVSIGCEEDEICWFFRDDDGKPANKDTLSRWCKRTYGLNFHEYKKQNSLMRLKIELRQSQLKLAKKSAAMAIFLGKNYLGQRDSVEYEDRESLARLDAILDGMRDAAKSEAE